VVVRENKSEGGPLEPRELIGKPDTQKYNVVLKRARSEHTKGERVRPIKPAGIERCFMPTLVGVRVGVLIAQTHPDGQARIGLCGGEGQGIQDLPRQKKF